MSSTVVVTGANGFVGRALVERLAAECVPVRAAVRRAGQAFACGVTVVETGALDMATTWAPALTGAATIVHCAARVHQLRDVAGDPPAAFMAVNRDATVHLARQAVAAGVRRFVFVSSIGVNGAETFAEPFRAVDVPAPDSPYARSKHEAEVSLRRVAKESGMELVIVRAPLVYGPGAPGNFATLLRAVHRGLPLPLGAIDNRRSFVAIGNLVDLLALAVRHRAAAGQTLLVSDGEDLSTTELLRRTARALGCRSRLFSVRASWLRAAATGLGRPELGQRLCGSLQIDLSATQQALCWEPPVGVDETLVATARHFLGKRSESAMTSE